MDVTVDMRVLELLSARLCHELIGPIAAIGNGVELLAEEEPEFMREAVALVGDSAKKAAKRLQFYRFAFGFGRGATLAGPPPHELVAGIFEGSRIGCDYDGSLRDLPLETQKLACTMVLVGAEGLPRGGHLKASGATQRPRVEAAGEGALLPPEIGAALSLASPPAALTSRTIGAYLAGLIARELGSRLVVATDARGRFLLEAEAM